MGGHLLLCPHWTKFLQRPRRSRMKSHREKRHWPARAPYMGVGTGLGTGLGRSPEGVQLLEGDAVASVWF